MSRPKTARTKQIENIALALNKPVQTIKCWCAEGLDPFNPDEIYRWFVYKRTRQRNRYPRRPDYSYENPQNETVAKSLGRIASKTPTQLDSRRTHV